MGKGNKCVFEYGKNHCKGLRYCPHLLWLRELDFNIRSNFSMCIGLGCGKFWCLCWDVKERKIGLDFCTACNNSKLYCKMPELRMKTDSLWPCADSIPYLLSCWMCSRMNIFLVLTCKLGMDYHLWIKSILTLWTDSDCQWILDFPFREHKPEENKDLNYLTA